MESLTNEAVVTGAAIGALALLLILMLLFYWWRCLKGAFNISSSQN